MTRQAISCPIDISKNWARILLHRVGRGNNGPKPSLPLSLRGLAVNTFAGSVG
jgi:hypothetical protein